MTKFKLKKIDYFGEVIYLYRDFFIQDVRFYDSPYASWRVFNIKVCKHPDTNEPVIHKGNEIYHNGNGTRKEMMEWVDDYYTEMNDYVTNDMEMIND